MKMVRVFGALALAMFAVTLASAQATGGLKIRVIDNSDKSEVIGAAVTLSNTNKLVATSSIITGADGVALFPVLRAGQGYVITVIMDGYAGIRQDAVVTNGTTKDVVVALAPEHVEKVVVTADKGQQVDLDSNETSTKFTSDFIADLPVAGRFYQNVLSLAPGVHDDDGDGNPNVNGARERDFKTQVGGISNVDPLTGTFLNLVTSDSIEDLTVITAGAGAEFGRAQGGFAQIIQKQGSNDFEGVFGMLYSSKLLDGNGATNTPDNLIPDFYLYQPSLQVSGPIVKDKLWYRLSQELIRREDPLVFAAGGDVNTLGTRRFSTDNQLTWQVSNRNKNAFNFRADPLTQTNVGISAINPSSSSEQLETGGPTYTLTWTAPYSPSLLVDSTVAYQDSKLSFTPMARGVSNQCVPDGNYLSPFTCFNVSSGLVSGSSLRDWHDSRQRLTVKSDATYYKGRMWGANHQFKVGMVVENERYFRSLERRPNFFRSPGLSTGGGPAQVNYNITTSLEPFSQQRAIGNTWGIYGEDILRPISNLSITLGLRIEQESITADGFIPLDPQGDSDKILAETEGQSPATRLSTMYATFVAYEDRLGALTAAAAQLPGLRLVPAGFYIQQSLWQRYRQPENINIHNMNFSPRLSVGWDPWNDGKTKFSMSAGRFYDKIFLGVVTTESEPVLANFSMKVANDEFPNNAAFIPSFAYSQVDRNLKTPYNDEYSFKAERTFLQENTISLTYIHRSFKDQLQDKNVNQTPGDWGKCFIALGPQDSPLVGSPGTGPITDPYTGEVYQDNDPGVGDGRLDDCTGMTVQLDGGRRRWDCADREYRRPTARHHRGLLRPQPGVGRHQPDRQLQHVEIRRRHARVRAPPVQELADGGLLHLVEGVGRCGRLQPRPRRRPLHPAGRAGLSFVRPPALAEGERDLFDAMGFPPRRDRAMGIRPALFASLPRHGGIGGPAPLRPQFRSDVPDPAHALPYASTQRSAQPLGVELRRQDRQGDQSPEGDEPPARRRDLQPAQRRYLQRVQQFHEERPAGQRHE
jgi:hypothetical protein